MEIKKAGLVVGVLVVMCLLQNVKAQSTTSIITANPVPTTSTPPATSTSTAPTSSTPPPPPTTTVTVGPPPPPPTTTITMTPSSSSVIADPSPPPPTTTITITPSSSSVHSPPTTTPSPTTMVVTSSSVVVTPPPPTTPPTTPPPPPSVNVSLKINFNRSAFDNAVNGSSPDGMRLREKLCHLITELLMNNSINLLSCNVTEVKPVSGGGGVVVVYELVFKATSEMDAEEVRKAVKIIKDAVKSGTIGEYAVNPDHPVNEKLIEPAVTIPPVSQNITKVNLKIKFKGDVFDGAVNDDFEGKALKLILKIIIKKNRKRILVVIIIAVRPSKSVEVEYDLVVNATSRDQSQEVIDAIQNQIKTGKIGNYTVDANYPIGAKITLQVDGKPEEKGPGTIDPTTLIVLLAVGLFLLFLVIILLVVLIVKLRNKED